MPTYPVVPTFITVHLGLPDSSAPNVTVPFTSFFCPFCWVIDGTLLSGPEAKAGLLASACTSGRINKISSNSTPTF